MPTVQNLKRAIEVAEKIEQLEAEIRQILGEPALPSPKRLVAKARNGARHGEEQGLAHVVREILVADGGKMRVAQIIDRLNEQGYKFQSKHPARSLGAQIYNLRGVKKAGRGLFKAEAV